MEKKPIGQSTAEILTRTFLIFFFGGFVLHYVVYTIYDICQIIWFNFLNYNPYCSQEQALDLMMQSLSVGLLAVLFSVVPIIVATIMAMLSYRVWGHVPFYSLFAIIPVCSFLEPLLIPRLNDILYIRCLTLLDIQQLLPFVFREVPVWIGCWWWSNHIPKRKKP